MKSLISPSLITILLLIVLISSCKQSVSPEDALLAKVDSLKKYKFSLEVNGIDYWITRYYKDTSNKAGYNTIETFDTIKSTLKNTFSFRRGCNCQYGPYFSPIYGSFFDSLYIQYQTHTGTGIGPSTYRNFTLDEALIVFHQTSRTIRYLRLQIVRGKDFNVQGNYPRGRTQLWDEFFLELKDINYSIENGIYTAYISDFDLRNSSIWFNIFKKYSNYSYDSNGLYSSQDENLKLLTDSPIVITDSAYIKFSLTP